MIYAFRKLALCVEKFVIYGLELQDKLGVTLSIFFRWSQNLYRTILLEMAWEIKGRSENKNIDVRILRKKIEAIYD
jgi:hypothetical protein